MDGTGLAAGDRIGPYLLVRTLGRGGMGQVWLAHDERLQRHVALKRLLIEEREDGSARKRILREARATARITHPNIATVYDVVEHHGQLFIVMEYVAGHSLAERLAQGRLPPTDVIDIARQLADGLAAAHAEGIVHRDLKPANIQAAASGAIKILDFGVARLRAAAATPTAETVVAPHDMLVTDGVNPGTQAYMSPEQLLGTTVDQRSDVYSLGVVLFELVVGHRPFTADDIVSLALAMTTTPAPAVHSLQPEVPRWFSDVVARCLARDPQERYQSADELKQALAVVARPPDRHAWRRLLAATAVVSALAILAWVAGPFRRPVVRATTIAVLPIDSVSSDAAPEAFARAVEGLVVSNLSGVRGITTVSRAALIGKSLDVAQLHRDLHVDYVVEMRVTAFDPRRQLTVRVRDTERGSERWSALVAGDDWTVARQTLDGLEAALTLVGVAPRGLPDADAVRFRRMPTNDAGAFARYLQARAFLDRSDVPGNPKRAADELKAIVDADPAFGAAHAWLAQAYCAQYERSKDPALVKAADAEATAALRAEPDAAATYMALGSLQNVTGRRDAAIESYRRAVQLDPNNDQAHRLLSVVLANRGDVEGAVREAKAAIALQPRSWVHHNALGLIYYNAARYADAAGEFRVVTDLEPSSARGYLMLGAALHQSGDVDQAIGNYEHSVRLSPNANALSNLATAYYERGRMSDAVRAFQSAVEADPASAVLRRNLGDALKKTHQTAAARQAYESCVTLGNRQLTINARAASTIALVALCEAELGRRGDAEAHATEALALAPADREVVYKNAAIAALFNDRSRTFKFLAEALKLGYQPSRARDDDDFASVATTREFRTLVDSKD